MKTGIYTITNTITNHIYVGAASDILKRLNQHLLGLRRNNHDNDYLQNSFNKYKEESFIFETLEECNKKYLYSQEHYWCNMLNTHNKSFGFNFTTIDIGGGFPGFDNEAGITFQDICQEIREGYQESFGDIKDSVSVMAEPGRFFCTKSHTLVFNIIGIKKKIDKQTQDVKYQYTINEGIYGSFSAVMFDYAKPIIKPFNERNEEELYPSTVFGPTCDSLDKITEDAMLPEMAVGDWCFVDNFGAYTRASSTSRPNRTTT